MIFNFELALTGFTTLAVSYFTYYTLKIYALRQKYKHIPGPVIMLQDTSRIIISNIYLNII